MPSRCCIATRGACLELRFSLFSEKRGLLDANLIGKREMIAAASYRLYILITIRQFVNGVNNLLIGSNWF